MNSLDQACVCFIDHNNLYPSAVWSSHHDLSLLPETLQIKYCQRLSPLFSLLLIFLFGLQEDCLYDMLIHYTYLLVLTLYLLNLDPNL